MSTWVWRKSNFSNGGNNNCVEVGRWRKSSFSEGTNNTSCVEVGHWRKSSFSNGGNNACVEVGFSDEVTALRDSKNPDGGALALSPTAWQSLRSTLTR